MSPNKNRNDRDPIQDGDAPNERASALLPVNTALVLAIANRPRTPSGRFDQVLRSSRILDLAIVPRSRASEETHRQFSNPQRPSPQPAQSDIIRDGQPEPVYSRSSMMTNQEIFRYLRAEPFRPFRIHMASGRTFDIRHPEMVRVGRNDLVVFSLVSDAPEIHDDWDTVSLILIESISHLDPAASRP
jgi:hypothetical protein